MAVFKLTVPEPSTVPRPRHVSSVALAREGARATPRTLDDVLKSLGWQVTPAARAWVERILAMSPSLDPLHVMDSAIIRGELTKTVTVDVNLDYQPKKKED